MAIEQFQTLIRDFYSANGRTMPWRIVHGDVINPYHIVVSEIMLQQTQVDRVIPKYSAFLEKFPDITSLAEASLQDVLQLWSGLGYNRRAKYLHDFAIEVDKSGIFPKSIADITAHKGFGLNTAAAILVYAYNEPHVFIETNVRTVYINCFFANKESVSDTEILEELVETIDRDNPREFYWGLMDYGTFLKKQGKGSLAKSKNHKKQSVFIGSLRQLRGKIIKLVSEKGTIAVSELEMTLQDDRLGATLQQLEKERLLRIADSTISID